MKDESQPTGTADVKNSAKESTATHTSEFTEFQKARKNRVVVTSTDNAAETMHIRRYHHS